MKVSLDGTEEKKQKKKKERKGGKERNEVIYNIATPHKPSTQTRQLNVKFMGCGLLKDQMRRKDKVQSSEEKKRWKLLLVLVPPPNLLMASCFILCNCLA